MKNILTRQLIFVPILYIIAKLLWGFIPFDIFNEILMITLNDLLGPLALMVVILLLCVYILWRIPGFGFSINFLFGTKPRVYGTWQGKLSYEYEGKKQEKTVYLVIKQSDGYSINIWLLTDERTSSSVFADIIPYKGGQRIYYSYETEDSPQNKEKNPLHYGFCQLDIENNNTLNGMYYTSRKTIGTLTFSKRKQKIVMGHDSAQKLFGIQ
jgi:hypothetical protein